MTEEKPAVATEPETPAQGAETDGGGAQEDQSLEALLGEWGSDESEPTGNKETQRQPDVDDDTDGETKFDQEKTIEELERRMQIKAKAEKDLADAIKTVKGDNVPLDDKMVEDILDGMARRNPKLNRAWTIRHKNPELWGKTLKALNKELSGFFAPKDTSASDTDDLVASAVHSAATKPTPSSANKDAFEMSPAEFEAHKMKKFGSA